MKHFLNSKVRVVLLLALVLVVAFALLSNLTEFDLPQKAVQGALTPIRSGFQSLTRQAEQYYNYMFRYEALAAENAVLRARVAELEKDARSVDSLERENKNFKKHVGFDPIPPGFSDDGYLCHRFQLRGLDQYPDH